MKTMKNRTRKSMKGILLCAVCGALIVSSCSKQQSSPTSVTNGTTQSGDPIYDKADVMPKYNGELAKYLSENIKYPEEAKQKNISGTVYLRFVVNKSGAVENASVMKGVNDLLDAEALRVVRSMPSWSPATIQGVPVSVAFYLPIKFELK